MQPVWNFAMKQNLTSNFFRVIALENNQHIVQPKTMFSTQSFKEHLYISQDEIINFIYSKIKKINFLLELTDRSHFIVITLQKVDSAIYVTATDSIGSNHSKIIEKIKNCIASFLVDNYYKKAYDLMQIAHRLRKIEITKGTKLDKHYGSIKPVTKETISNFSNILFEFFSFLLENFSVKFYEEKNVIELFKELNSSISFNKLPQKENFALSEEEGYWEKKPIGKKPVKLSLRMFFEKYIKDSSLKENIQNFEKKKKAILSILPPHFEQKEPSDPFDVKEFFGVKVKV